MRINTLENEYANEREYSNYRMTTQTGRLDKAKLVVTQVKVKVKVKVKANMDLYSASS